jgi:hypothetical protein
MPLFPAIKFFAHLLLLGLSSLCVAGAACLGELTGEGELEPNKTEAKKPFGLF